MQNFSLLRRVGSFVAAGLLKRGLRRTLDEWCSRLNISFRSTTMSFFANAGCGPLLSTRAHPRPRVDPGGPPRVAFPVVVASVAWHRQNYMVILSRALAWQSVLMD